MQTLYELVDPANARTKAWLKNTVVVMDPCLNPDGHDRYVNFYNSVKGTAPNPDPASREHAEPWPGGRVNHYYFDLNRDWAWQTQKETQERMALYNQWLPQVHVAEAGGGTVNVTLDRGAVIQGKVQWDDGSPAAGVNMSVQTTGSTTGTAASYSTDMVRTVSQLGGAFGGGFGGFQTTDDRGVFRITGLPPGSYWVRAVVMTPSAEAGAGTFQRMTSVVMYAPGKVRRTDAQVFTMKPGEERDDVQFTVDLSALHTVSGHVGATDSGSIVAGVVRLTDTQDSSLSRMAMVQPDGSFVVQWVPAGTYTLAVSNASNVPRAVFAGGRRGQQNESGGTSYAPFQESLTVADTDVSGVGVTLTPATNQ